MEPISGSTESRDQHVTSWEWKNEQRVKTLEEYTRRARINTSPIKIRDWPSDLDNLDSGIETRRIIKAMWGPRKGVKSNALGSRDWTPGERKMVKRSKLALEASQL